MANEPNELYILWTNADFLTSDKMVMMYATNSLRYGWWEKVTVVIWGATAKLAAENPAIQEKIRIAQTLGVHVLACKACADQLGVTAALEALGIEVIYWGEGLTEVLKGDAKLLSV